MARPDTAGCTENDDSQALLGAFAHGASPRNRYAGGLSALWQPPDLVGDLAVQDLFEPLQCPGDAGAIHDAGGRSGCAR